VERGDGAHARPLLERALTLVGETPDDDPLNLADVRATLARALLLPGGDEARARSLAAAAAAAYEDRGRGAERRLREMRELATASTPSALNGRH
jgi:hypothetical protein